MDAETPDPFQQIQAEIEAELAQITTLQAKLFSGHGEVAAPLHSRLAAVQEQLSALEGAVQQMVAAPAHYGLSAAAAFGRQVRERDSKATGCVYSPHAVRNMLLLGPQVEVETLRYTLTDLQDTCAQAETSVGVGSSSSIELPTIQPPGATISRPPIRHSKLVQSHGQGQHGKQPSAAAAGPHGRSSHHQHHNNSSSLDGDDTRGWGDGGGGHDDVSYEAVMQQQMRQQDEALDHISIHVDRIKHTGQLMHEELEEQAGLLSGLQEETDTTQMRLRAARRKVADVIKQAAKDRQLCLILSLSCVLVVLTILAIA